VAAGGVAIAGDLKLAQALFAPRAVALVGASGDPAKNTARPQRFLRLHGYTARVLPINPSRAEVLGGLGYSQEELVEYCLRRCRGWMIAGGSIEILKNRIAESIFGRSFSQRPGQ